jgi:hypothetical protein
MEGRPAHGVLERGSVIAVVPWDMGQSETAGAGADVQDARPAVLLREREETPCCACARGGDTAAVQQDSMRHATVHAHV